MHDFLLASGNVYASAEIYYSIGAIFSGFLFKDLFIGVESSELFWKDSIFFLEPLSLKVTMYIF